MDDGLKALARAYSQTKGRRVDEYSMLGLRAAAMAAQELELAAQSFGLRCKTFKPERVLFGVNLSADGLSATGSVSMDFGARFESKSFEGKVEDTLAMAEDAALRLMLSVDPDYEKGWKPGGVEGGMKDGFMAWAKDQKGMPGRLAKWAQLEGDWHESRESIRTELSKRVDAAIEAGLLAPSMKTGRLRLAGGLPRESLWLVEWSGRNEAGKRIDFLVAKPGSNPSRPAWRLPTMGDGVEAIWGSLCAQIALAHQAGWEGAWEGRLDGGQAEKFAATVEKFEIAEQTAAGASNKRKRGI